MLSRRGSLAKTAVQMPMVMLTAATVAKTTRHPSRPQMIRCPVEGSASVAGQNGFLGPPSSPPQKKETYNKHLHQVVNHTTFHPSPEALLLCCIDSPGIGGWRGRGRGRGRAPILVA